MGKNRFAALLEEKGVPAGEITERIVEPFPATPIQVAAPAPIRVVAEPPPSPPPPPPAAASVAAASAAAALKTGKRSDPNYRQISTYVRGDLYKQVRKRLTDEERDFAELLDELLEKWIAN